MIKLLDNWAITTDEHNYILGTIEQRTNKETLETKDAVKAKAYYSNLEQAVKGYIEILLREKVKSNDIKTFTGYLKELTNLKNQITEILKPYKI